jgi:hypothetical protein
MEFVVDEAALGWDFSEYFGLHPANHSNDCSTLIIIQQQALTK